MAALSRHPHLRCWASILLPRSTDSRNEGEYGMNETLVPGIEELRNWTGRTEAARDILTPRLARELSATLGDSDELPEPGTPAPYAAHWCLAPPIVTSARIGADGHPARGSFLPPVPLPRRMWAAGALQFHDGLLMG